MVSSQILSFNLKLCSFNSRSCSIDKSIISKKFLEDGNSVLAVQEHFLLGKNLNKLKNQYPEFAVIGQAAHKDSSSLCGRPKGGLAFILPEGWIKWFKLIPISTWRIQAILLTLNNVSYLLVNCYLPVDDCKISSTCNELIDTLAVIDNIIKSNNHDKLCNGDLNFSPDRNSSHSEILKQFMLDRSLVSS